MSKKMLKRSLALGALMAFVITGSAMAAEVTDFTDAEKHVGRIEVDDSKISSLDNLFINSTGDSGLIIDDDSTNVNVNLEKLKINALVNGIEVGGTSGGTTIIVADEIDIDTLHTAAGAGPGIIIQTGSNQNLTIKDFEKFDVNTALTEGHAICNNGTGKLVIQGKDNSSVNIVAAENAVYTRLRDDGEISISGTNVTIESKGVGGDSKGHAVCTEGKKSTITIRATNDVTISTVQGKDAIRINGSEDDVRNSSISVNAGNTVDIDGQIYNRQGSLVDIDGKYVEIDTNGEDAIWSSGGTVDVNATESIKVTSVGKDGIQTEGATVNLNAKKVEIISDAWGVNSTRDADSDVSIVADDVIISGSEGGIRSLGNDSEVELNGKNSTKITGDIVADDTSKISATFNGEASFLTGAVKTGNNANTKLNFNGATWNVTGESTVTEICGTDANIKVKDAKAATGWVKVGNVTATNLTVATETEDSNTQETLDALSGVAVLVDENGEEVGKAADQVQLKNAIYDNVVGNVTDNGVEIVDKQVASANVSVNDMAAIGLMSWRAEMNDMNKRMGELRNANGEHGVWVRMVRGESEYNSVKNQYNQYQLGYDEKLSVDKRWTVGVALSYTDAENNFAQGNGESTNKALSIYGSKLNDDGTFVDLIAKYARLENDFETFSGMGAADYDANGYSFSAEFGKRIQQGKGLWIEPQVELTYGKVGSVDYVTENGVSVAQDSMDSLVGRIGFSLGKDIEKGNVYARASYLYDFDGETKATLNNDAVLENDLGGGWWEVGVGANINLSKATYIYADVEKTFGGEVDTNWQWNLGVRYSF